MSLKDLIIQHLRKEYPKIVHKGELGKLAVMQWGFENENLGRRCRELENEKLIKKFKDEKGRAMYRYIDKTQEVQPFSLVYYRQLEEAKKPIKEPLRVNQLSLL